jgi:hypothetical protein
MLAAPKPEQIRGLLGLQHAACSEQVLFRGFSVEYFVPERSRKTRSRKLVLAGSGSSGYL